MISLVKGEGKTPLKRFLFPICCIEETEFLTHIYNRYMSNLKAFRGLNLLPLPRKIIVFFETLSGNFMDNLSFRLSEVLDLLAGIVLILLTYISLICSKQ